MTKRKRISKKPQRTQEHENVFSVGVDPALSDSGICILNGDGDIVYTESIVTTNKDHLNDFHRTMYICKRLQTAIEENCLMADKINVLIELPGASRFAGKLIVRLELVGFIKLMAFNARYGVYVCQATTMKKFVFHGGASKEGVMLAVERLWGLRTKNDNIADAVVAAKLCHSFYRDISIAEVECIARAG